MAIYSLLIKPSAAKELENLPANRRLKIAKKIQSLAGNHRPQGCEKLSAGDLYRIRQGEYRILYSIQDKVPAVVVVRIGHRREVYR